MTRLIHDKFAKDYLAEMLSPLGAVNPGREVTAEVRYIDVYFTPTTEIPSYREKLGILGKMAETTALFEPFRNPVTVSEACGCLSKLLESRREMERQSRRNKTSHSELPKLWILTPTGSDNLLNGFNVTSDRENWCSRIYFLGEHLRTAIVVIHQLPEIPETLWLRILGKGSVQQRAIASLSALAVDEPLRINALELVYQLQSSLFRKRVEKLPSEDEELLVAIAPLFQEQLAAAKQEGIERGIEQGRIEGQRAILENFIRVRWGELDPVLTAFIAPVSALSPVDFTMLLVQLSTIYLDQNAVNQARQLLAENVLRMRFGEVRSRISSVIPNLLALSPEELGLLLSQLPQLSLDELLERLDNPLG